MNAKYWKKAGAVGLLIASLCGTAYSGTYVYYNDKGEIVRYAPKKQTDQNQSQQAAEAGKSSSVKSVKQAPVGDRMKQPE